MNQNFYLIKIVPVTGTTTLCKLVRVQKKVFDITEAYREVNTDIVECVTPAKDKHFPNIVMIVDEEGKFKKSMPNFIATLIFNPDSGFDVIVGNALLCKQNPRTYNWEAFTFEEAVKQMDVLTTWISKIRPKYEQHVQYCVINSRKEI